MLHPIGDYHFSQFEYNIIFKVESKKDVMGSSFSWRHSYPASHDLKKINMFLFEFLALKSKRV